MDHATHEKHAHEKPAKPAKRAPAVKVGRAVQYFAPHGPAGALVPEAAIVTETPAENPALAPDAVGLQVLHPTGGRHVTAAYADEPRAGAWRLAAD